ncbi:CoxG family protein [Gluconacetobacter asukensis]|uniref:Carbon monoxide dehydrogenase subunit G n=1 Tax=Gluconacetobacter asukensis TaxID=1017181 RepID=A0A7W4IZ59_9PROT|nr:carbon monoxide dehydrogenase subunit G [Gluconacetobacter asukensis]MBB2171785.1 carbon monoxide dehydrogenase subunit G [Gluconacetobacter asukensis]
MNIEGQHEIAAPVDIVWRALNDPEILRRSVPGCTLFELSGPDEYAIQVEARIGPLSARFGGKAQISDIVPGRSYVLSGRGQGGAAGFAQGMARVRLEARNEATLLHYEGSFDVGGKLASVGARMIDGLARDRTEDFFRAFSAIVVGGEAAAPEPAPGPAGRAAMEGGTISKIALVLSGMSLLLALAALLRAGRRR